VPRGGSTKGGHNNHLTRTNATPAEISNLSSYALAVFQAQTPDLHNPEEVREAIITYFNNCTEHGLRPGNLGLYAALGMSKQDYHDTVTGKNKSKVSPDCIDIIKKAARAVGVFREGLALEGKINPITYIFMGKNYDHLADSQQIEVTANSQTSAAQLTREELRKRIPVYSDVEQAE
jgi:hypothetical protein